MSDLADSHAQQLRSAIDRNEKLLQSYLNEAVAARDAQFAALTDSYMAKIDALAGEVERRAAEVTSMGARLQIASEAQLKEKQEKDDVLKLLEIERQNQFVQLDALRQEKAIVEDVLEQLRYDFKVCCYNYFKKKPSKRITTPCRSLNLNWSSRGQYRQATSLVSAHFRLDNGPPMARTSHCN